MKKFLFLITALLVVSAVKSQTQDTTKNTPRKKTIIIEDTWNKSKSAPQKTIKKTTLKTDTVKPKIEIIGGWRSSKRIIERENNASVIYNYNKKQRFYGHWAGLEFGFNTFVNPDYSMYDAKYDVFMELNQLRSFVLNLNFWEFSIGLQEKRNTIGLVTGLGVEWNNYRFDKKYTIQTDDKGVIQPIEFDEDWSIRKSRLSSLYLNMPLLMEFQIPSCDYNRAHIAIGAVAGLRLLSYTRTKYQLEKDSRRRKKSDRFSLNNIRYSAMLRIGYGSFDFYATYDISQLFEKGKGPKLTPFTIGVTLISF